MGARDGAPRASLPGEAGLIPARILLKEHTLHSGEAIPDFVSSPTPPTLTTLCEPRLRELSLRAPNRLRH